MKSARNLILQLGRKSNNSSKMWYCSLVKWPHQFRWHLSHGGSRPRPAQCSLRSLDSNVEIIIHNSLEFNRERTTHETRHWDHLSVKSHSISSLIISDLQPAAQEIIKCSVSTLIEDEPDSSKLEKSRVWHNLRRKIKMLVEIYLQQLGKSTLGKLVFQFKHVMQLELDHMVNRYYNRKLDQSKTEKFDVISWFHLTLVWQLDQNETNSSVEWLQLGKEAQRRSSLRQLCRTKT